MIEVHSIAGTGDVSRFLLISLDKRTLQDIDYNLNPKPHEGCIKKHDAVRWEMVIDGAEMSEILSRFSCID